MDILYTIYHNYLHVIHRVVNGKKQIKTISVIAVQVLDRQLVTTGLDAALKEISPGVCLLVWTHQHVQLFQTVDRSRHVPVMSPDHMDAAWTLRLLVCFDYLMKAFNLTIFICSSCLGPGRCNESSLFDWRTHDVDDGCPRSGPASHTVWLLTKLLQLRSASVLLWESQER